MTHNNIASHELPSQLSDPLKSKNTNTWILKLNIKIMRHIQYTKSKHPTFNNVLASNLLLIHGLESETLKAFWLRSAACYSGNSL